MRGGVSLAKRYKEILKETSELRPSKDKSVSFKARGMMPCRSTKTGGGNRKRAGQGSWCKRPNEVWQQMLLEICKSPICGAS